MSTTVKTGWLKDSNGDKFAPKTLASQVQMRDGTLIEDKIQSDINNIKKEIPTKTSDLTNDSNFITAADAPNEIYVGDGEMPETATIQILMDGSDEEQALMDELKEYIDGEIDDATANIAQDIISQLQGLPVFGVVDKNNIITVTSQLSDGTYVLKYENADGTTTEIGTITVGTGTGGGSGGEPDVPDAVEVDIASIGYTDNARWSISSGTLKTDTSAQGYTAINIVPITRPSGKTVTIELSGIIFTGKSNAAILPYVNDEFNSNGPMYLNEDHDYSADTGLKNFCHEDGSVTVVWDKVDWTGFKFNGYGSGADAKITYTIE